MPRFSDVLWGIRKEKEFSRWLSGEESACQAGDLGLIAGSGSCLEEENGNHSSILAWRIPWTEKSGRLQSVGSQRVGHN